MFLLELVKKMPKMLLYTIKNFVIQNKSVVAKEIKVV